MELIKYQALAGCILQSGLSISDILDRTYGDVHKELEAGTIPLCLAPENSHLFRHKKVGRNKHVKFLSFIGQTAVDLLKEYLSTRGPLTDKDPLFAIDQRTAEDYIARHAEKLYGEYEGMNPWRLHGLRDLFKKRALLSPLKSKEGESYIEYFSAHDLAADVAKRYDTMTREEWRNIYAECQPFLEFTVENPQAAQ
jgi:integrase